MTRIPMNLIYDKNWHLKRVGEGTTYSTNVTTLPLGRGGGGGGEESYVAPYTTVTFGCTKDLNAEKVIRTRGRNVNRSHCGEGLKWL